MRKLSQLWRALERIPGLLAVPGFWREYCGPDFPLIEPYLQPTDHVGATYPCPHPTAGQCPRKIVDYGDGEFVAICRDPYESCADVPLVRKEVLAHRLDIVAFTKAISPVLGIRWHPPEKRGDHTWGIGLSGRRSSHNQPAYFIALPESRRFAVTVNSLLLDISGPFLILSPTNRHRSIEIQQRLQARGVGFLSLEEQLLLDENDRLVSVDPTEASDEPAQTPVADRTRVVKAFTTRHQRKVKDIYETAGVDESDFYKWRRGELPDTSQKSRDVERILHQGLPRRLSK